MDEYILDEVIEPPEVIQPPEIQLIEGAVKKLTDGAGIIGFKLNGEEKRALFFKENVFINNSRIPHQDSLLARLYISMPVVIKIADCTIHGFSFEAIYVEISAEYCRCSPFENRQTETGYFGTVQTLTETNGSIEFFVDNSKVEAVVFQEDLIIDGVKVKQGTSLSSLLKVGLPVTFQAVNSKGSFRVTHLLKNLFSGIVETLTEMGGSILFQWNNMKSRAIFSVENVYIGDTRLEAGPFLSSLLKIGILVFFRLAESERLDDSLNEATVVLILPRQRDPDVHRGTIRHLSEHSGQVAFQMNNTEVYALFFKKNIRFCDMKLKSGIPLLTLLELNMQVSLNVEESKDNSWKATLVHIETIPKCFSASVIADSSSNQVYHGTVLRVEDTCGVIEFSVDKQKEKAIFFSDSVFINNKKLNEDVSLPLVLDVCTSVSLRVKACSELNNCNFVATAVELEPPDIYGTIVILEETCGVLTFWKNNKQQRAIFFKSNIRINQEKLKSCVSFSSVLRVGMYVPITVQKCKQNGFSFKATCVEVKEDSGHNVNQVSTSQHITCGLGTVVEIVSATTARLQFELDGQHVVLFKLSDFFVCGRRCDDSTCVSKDDIYFFDATKGNDNGYSITCVWQGTKPELSTLLEPHKALIQDCRELPGVAVGSVVAVFPPQAAIVLLDSGCPVLLSIDCLKHKEELQLLTEENSIQDFVSVGDMLTLGLCSKSKFSGFLLTKYAQRIKSEVPLEKSNSSCKPLIPEPLPVASNKDTLRHDQLLPGVIACLAAYSGTIEVEVDNRKEVVAFTKNEVRINKEELSSSLPLSSVLAVGMSVSLTITSSPAGALKATLVEPTETSSSIDSRLFYGSVESGTNGMPIILFPLHDKDERVTFGRENVYYNNSKPKQATRVIMSLVEVGMRVSLRIARSTDVADYNYKAVAVHIEDSHLAVYGFGVALNHKQEATVFHGVINSIREYGIVEFNMDGRNHKAVCSIKKWMGVNMPVKFRLGVLNDIFRATQVVISLDSQVSVPKGIESSRSLPDQPVADIREQLGQVTNYLSSSVGSIECCISGKKYEANFNKDMITYHNNSESKLQSMFAIGEMVRLNGNLKYCVGDMRLVITCVWHIKGCEKCPSPCSSDTKTNEEELQAVADLEIKDGEGQITGYPSPSVGLLECCFGGQKFEARFTEDIICDYEKMSSGLRLGEVVKFDGKFKLFMGKLKLWLLCVWHDQASQTQREELWKFADSLCVGEYVGTVLEMLNSDTLIATIKNVPVLVSKAILPSLKNGDSVTMVIKSKCGVWVAADAWRTCSVSSGLLITLRDDYSVLLDVNKVVHFQSTNTLLFGVSLGGLNLTHIFKLGDKFQYFLCPESQAPNVWFGSLVLDEIHQQQEVLNFCHSRSISSTLRAALMWRMANQKNSCGPHSLNFTANILPKTVPEKQILDRCEKPNQIYNQQLSVKAAHQNSNAFERLMPVCSQPPLESSHKQLLNELKDLQKQTLKSERQIFNTSKCSTSEKRLNRQQLEKAFPLGSEGSQRQAPNSHGHHDQTVPLDNGNQSRSTGPVEKRILLEGSQRQAPNSHGQHEQTVPLDNGNQSRSTGPVEKRILLEGSRRQAPNSHGQHEQTVPLDNGNQSRSTGPVEKRILLEGSQRQAPNSHGQDEQTVPLDNGNQSRSTGPVEKQILLEGSQRQAPNSHGQDEQTVPLDNGNQSRSTGPVEKQILLEGSQRQAPNSHGQREQTVPLDNGNQSRSTGPVEKRILLDLLPVEHRNSAVLQEVLDSIESGIKNCIRGHLLNEAIECLEGEVNSKCLKKKVEAISCLREKKIDRGTQTLSTGPVFFTGTFNG